jgi:hypothetical protein
MDLKLEIGFIVPKYYQGRFINQSECSESHRQLLATREDCG